MVSAVGAGAGARTHHDLPVATRVPLPAPTALHFFKKTSIFIPLFVSILSVYLDVLFNFSRPAIDASAGALIQQLRCLFFPPTISDGLQNLLS